MSNPIDELDAGDGPLNIETLLAGNEGDQPDTCEECSGMLVGGEYKWCSPCRNGLQQAAKEGRI